MSFRIVAGEIEYEYRPFARIIMPEHSALYDRAIREIEDIDSRQREVDDQKWQEEIETLSQRISHLKEEIDYWRAIARRPAATVTELTRPKPRRPRKVL